MTWQLGRKNSIGVGALFGARHSQKYLVLVLTRLRLGQRAFGAPLARTLPGPYREFCDRMPALLLLLPFMQLLSCFSYTLASWELTSG